MSDRDADDAIDRTIAAIIAGGVGPADPAAREFLRALEANDPSDPIVARVAARESAARQRPDPAKLGRLLEFAEPEVDDDRSDRDVRALINALVTRLRERQLSEGVSDPSGRSFGLLSTILNSLVEKADAGQILDDGSLFAALLDVANRKYTQRNPAQPSGPVSLRLVRADEELPDAVIDHMVAGCQKLIDQAEDEHERRVRLLALQEKGDAEIAREVGDDVPVIRGYREVALHEIQLLDVG